MDIAMTANVFAELCALSFEKSNVLSVVQLIRRAPLPSRKRLSKLNLNIFLHYYHFSITMAANEDVMGYFTGEGVNLDQSSALPFSLSASTADLNPFGVSADTAQETSATPSTPFPFTSGSVGLYESSTLRISPLLCLSHLDLELL